MPVTRVVAAVAVTCTAAFSCTPTCSCDSGPSGDTGHDPTAAAARRAAPPPPVRMSAHSPAPPPRASAHDSAQRDDASPEQAEAAATRRTPVPLTEEEIAKVVPTIADTRVLEEPTIDPTSGRVETKLCLDGRSMFDAVAALNQSLIRDGWTNLHERAHPSRHDRVSVAAERPPYRLSATVQLGNWPECGRHEGRAYASLVIHKVGAPGEPAPRTPPRSP